MDWAFLSMQMLTILLINPPVTFSRAPFSLTRPSEKFNWRLDYQWLALENRHIITVDKSTGLMDDVCILWRVGIVSLEWGQILRDWSWSYAEPENNYAQTDFCQPGSQASPQLIWMFMLGLICDAGPGRDGDDWNHEVTQWRWLECSLGSRGYCHYLDEKDAGWCRVYL